MNNSLPRKGWLYPIIISFVTVVILAAIGIVYTGYIARQSDHRWCELLNTLTEANSKTPPTTELGRKYAEELFHLKNDFKC